MAKTEQVKLALERIDVEYDERGDALYIALNRMYGDRIKTLGSGGPGVN